MIKSTVFTRKELEVIDKKISNEKLNQIDSNYLYKFIRPKLREIASIDANLLLNKMEYHQKIKSIEERIKKIIEIKKILKEYSIKADIEIIDEKTLEKIYNHQPSLIYQLKDHKIIYGVLKLKNKPEIYRIDLRMKLDWSYIESNAEGVEIYKALRNTILVRLLLNGIIDNRKLKDSLNDEIGKNIIERLKNNQESKLDRKLALSYLKNLLEKTEKEVKGELWEKIRL